ncbi:hypothetical protein PV325_008872 [Microctonus aethiopoides]|uniref:BED-type domain-containing protein n=1 Tax=Microctonus aethiopoides TaxID=144406 RepID=A0AA39FLU9_9HYME|nr:hypothetical protein PV326_006000 [Microctonus aethiopoides]KAK0089152.1 hypothetical protein PV325_008872 [Microctonus aethiopoides]KAK0171679.1 hypothetical protein PV328_005101 [Microctonus aethiopoides]
MDNFSTPRYEGKIETFDPCIIDEHGNETAHDIVNQNNHENQIVHSDNHANNETVNKLQENHESSIQMTSPSPNPQQNLTLTPVRLPAILDGDFFSVIRVDNSNVTVKCTHCLKLLNGNLKSTGNFLSHIKRVHPFLIERIKCKSNQRKPAIAYVDLSVDKYPEIIKTKRGYRKCYRTDENLMSNNDDSIDQSMNNWSDEPAIKKYKSSDHESPDMNRFAQNNALLMEDEFDAIGRNVAVKLRNMRIDQRIVAEKLLNDVLFEGQLGTLHRDSNIHV